MPTIRTATTVTRLLFAIGLFVGLLWPAGRPLAWALAGAAAWAAAVAVHRRQRRMGEFDTVEYGVASGAEAEVLARRDTALFVVAGFLLLGAAVVAARAPDWLTWL